MVTATHYVGVIPKINQLAIIENGTVNNARNIILDKYKNPKILGKRISMMYGPICLANLPEKIDVFELNGDGTAYKKVHVVPIQDSLLTKIIKELKQNIPKGKSINLLI